MNAITFAHPWVLWFLLLIPLLIVWYVLRYRKQKPALQFSDITLFRQLHTTWRHELRHLPYILRVVAVLCLVVALARPQKTLGRQETNVEGIDIMLAVDVSGTMLAQDFRPNRLEAAKKVAANFIMGRPNDRIGLVPFAGEAFTMVPLTIDHQVLNTQLNTLSNNLVEDGTAIGDALATAINRIKKSEAKSKVIILLTDGDNNRGSIDPQMAAEIAQQFGIRLYTIAMASNAPTAPYPAKTIFGTTVMQQIPNNINEPLLRKMAQSTDDGRYFRATNKKSLETIFSEIDKMEKSKMEVLQYKHFRDFYAPFLWGALICLVLEVLLRWGFLREGT